MLSSPAKRTLTEHAHVSMLSSEVQRSDALPDDLTASIRNAALRARKNVLEGYRNETPSAPPTTPYSSPEKPTRLTSVVSPLPANDAIRDVFSSAPRGGYSPMPSPSKRRRSDFDREIEKGTTSDEDSDVEMRIEDPVGVISTVAADGSLGRHAMRPMKPLRQPSKSLMPKTHPAAEVVGLLRFHGKADIVTSISQPAEQSGEGGSTASDDSPLYSMKL